MTNGGGEMLVAVPGRWDEACFLIPAVRALAASGLRTGVLCEERQRFLWETVEGISVAGVSAPKLAAAEIFGKWAAAMIWEKGAAAEACVRARIPRRIGPDAQELRKFLTHPVDISQAPGPVEHRVRQYLSVLEKLGIETGRAEFFLPAAFFPEREKGTVVLCADSDFGRTYEWPVERWAEVAKALLADGLKITVIGLPGGRDLGKSLAAALAEGVEFRGTEPGAELLGFFASQERVVAAESSLPHLAAHAGATCLTLFGPGDPAWRRPLGKRHGLVRRHVECAPCFLPKCPLDLRCQNELTVERVLAAARGMLGSAL